jgi:hypothetical protein
MTKQLTKPALEDAELAANIKNVKRGSLRRVD